MKLVEIHFEKNGNPVEALTVRNEALELSGAVFFWTVLKKRLRAGPSDPDHGIFRDISSKKLLTNGICSCNVYMYTRIHI